VSASQAVISAGNLLHIRASQHLAGYTFTKVVVRVLFQDLARTGVSCRHSTQGIIDLVARDLEILVLSPRIASTMPWITV